MSGAVLLRLLQINLDLMGEKRGILLSIAIRWRETACAEGRTVRAGFYRRQESITAAALCTEFAVRHVNVTLSNAASQGHVWFDEISLFEEGCQINRLRCPSSASGLLAPPWNSRWAICWI